MRSTAAALTALVCAVLLVACGGSGSDEDQIRDVVQDFGEAANDKDAGAICGLVVSKELEDEEDCEKRVDKEGLIGGLESVKDIEIRDIKVDGDSATAKIKATLGDQTDEGPGKFRKVDGEWKLDLDG